ncbi:hypothetical protein BC829DRAFT_379138 [Chytridium lagenaria]|nr:hypothetical protein BC829DRAFT_379138 [Chytridium lagenaria]
MEDDESSLVSHDGLDKSDVEGDFEESLMIYTTKRDVHLVDPRTGECQDSIIDLIRKSELDPHSLHFDRLCMIEFVEEFSLLLLVHRRESCARKSCEVACSFFFAWDLHYFRGKSDDDRPRYRLMLEGIIPHANLHQPLLGVGVKRKISSVDPNLSNFQICLLYYNTLVNILHLYRPHPANLLTIDNVHV